MRVHPYRLRCALGTLRAVGRALVVAPLLAMLMSIPAASALPGPPSLSSGFDADTVFFDANQVSLWFPRMEQLGSRWVRIPVVWRQIAPPRRPPRFRPADPRDPRYRWTNVDDAVRAAVASHQHVLLMLDSAPDWAEARGAPRSTRPGTWRPDPAAYGAFAHAVAERYSGRFPDPARRGRALPRVSYFQAWNEPNLAGQLAPTWTRARHGFIPSGALIYRRLLNSLYAAVKAVQPRAYVLAAGLAPYGEPPGFLRIQPVTFLSALLCLYPRPQRCPDRAHFDAIDVHPYGLTPTHHAFSPNDVSVPDVGRLERVLAVAARTGTALPPGRKPIWVTEIGWDTTPPVPGGVSIAQQARYLARAWYELWLAGVSHIMWYEPRDSAVPSGAFTGSGLFFNTGAAKPSSLAFRFPFVAIRGRRGMTVLWGHAPPGGLVTIEVARRGGWRPLLRLRTTGGHVFYALRRLAAHLTLRATAAGVASYPWSTG